jgi:hypothetical protein
MEKNEVTYMNSKRHPDVELVPHPTNQDINGSIDRELFRLNNMLSFVYRIPQLPPVGTQLPSIIQTAIFRDHDKGEPTIANLQRQHEEAMNWLVKAMQKYDRLSDAGPRFQYLASMVRWLAPSPLRQRAMNAFEIECRAVNPPSSLLNASELREWRRVEETRRKSEVAAEGFASGNEDYVDLTLDSPQPKEERSRKTNHDDDVLDDDVLDDDQPQQMTERRPIPKSVRALHMDPMIKAASTTGYGYQMVI